jgi:2-polyprenyl-3-methyl-5-hydroxy-6-metoxy-1,4-benzoquinol methylase
MRAGGFVRAPDPVGEYFADKASDYRSRSIRFPWTWTRRRELRAVRSLLGDVTGADVLELGAGAGFYTQDLMRSGVRHVWAVDISAAMLGAPAARAHHAVLGDAAAVELERRFPVLVSTGMLEFVKDPKAVLANAARHAEPGARFVVLVPAPRILRASLPALPTAVTASDIHLFDEAWFAATAPRCGWRVATSVRVAPFSLAARLSRM